jgi:PEP-CTERM motif
MQIESRYLAVALGAFMIACTVAPSARSAEFLMVGTDTNASAAEYSLSGTFLGTFGPTGATGTAFDGVGHVFIAYPSLEQIKEFNGSGTLLNTISTGAAFPEDLTYAGGSLFVSGAFSGTIERIDPSTGTVLSSFSAPFGTGLASDGSFLYTSDGFSGVGVITKRMFDGTVISTISTGFGGNLSLARDPSDGSFYISLIDSISHYDAAGNFLGSFATPDSPYYHDGLDVGSFGAVPEPSTWAMMVLGFAGLGFAGYRRSRKGALVAA